MADFFISFTSADRPWASWIAWELEAAGYSVVFQDWDFAPGSDFVIKMQRAAAETDRTVAVLSPNYFSSGFTQPEWSAAFHWNRNSDYSAHLATLSVFTATR